jgi:hypothetical protein
MGISDIFNGAFYSAYEPVDYSDNALITAAQEARGIQNSKELSEMLSIYPSWAPVTSASFSVSSSTSSNEKTLDLIKKSIKQIKAEAVSPEAQQRIGEKIARLKKLGVNKQAAVLETELQVRIKLARVQEWSYKVLPYDVIKQYDGKSAYGYTYKVHIDPLNQYNGVAGGEMMTEAKDKIIPDEVLAELEIAIDRQVFDSYSVLWVEKVKDPLLLGSFNGCRDYFLIAQWGDDIKFDDIVKAKKK